MNCYFLFWFLCLLSCKTSESLRIAYVCMKKGKDRKSPDLLDSSLVLKYYYLKKKGQNNLSFTLFLFSSVSLLYYWAPSM